MTNLNSLKLNPRPMQLIHLIKPQGKAYSLAMKAALLKVHMLPSKDREEERVVDQLYRKTEEHRK